MSAPGDLQRNWHFLICEIGHGYTMLFESKADNLGITLAEAKVLMCLSRYADLNQTELSGLSGVEPMALVRILNKMEADNWLERRPHPTDRRAWKLHLKMKALSVIDRVRKLVSQVNVQMLAEFTPEECSAMIDLLERAQMQMLHMLAERTGRMPHGVAQSQRNGVELRSARTAARTSISGTGRAPPTVSRTPPKLTVRRAKTPLN